MKRLAAAILVGILIAGAVWILFREPITLALARRMIASRMAADAVAGLRAAHPGALHVILCGTAAPLPDPSRAGPCTAIVTPTRFLVVDAGSHSARSLLLLGARVGEVDAVLLTHFHSDHIDGLGELMMQRWAGGANDEPVAVHGPEGVGDVVRGFNQAYGADAGYRVAHHGAEIVPPSGAGGLPEPFPVPAPGEAVVVFEEDGLRVTAFAVDHEPVHPAVGYRFDHAGRSVVVSGDTSKSDNVARFAKGADVLVHEGLAPHLVALMTEAAREAGRPNIETITRDILTYHASPVEAAEVAREAGAGLLVFTHLVPPLPIAPLERLFTKGVAEVWSGPVVVGRDGMTFTLPAHTDEILRGSL